jgi:hypothetical protein
MIVAGKLVLIVFLRALRCVSSRRAKNGLPPQHAKTARAGDPRSRWEQLRAGLRRKEGAFSSALWPDSAAIASLRPPQHAKTARRGPRLRSAQAKRSSRALTLVSWAEAREER